MDKPIVVTNLTVATGLYVLASVLAFVLGIVFLLTIRRRTGRISWTEFVFMMFVSVLLLDLGLWEQGGRANHLLSVIRHAIEIMKASGDFTTLEAAEGNKNLADSLYALNTYGLVLSIVAPVSIVAAILEYFADAFSRLLLRAESLVVDSFVFSCLDRRTLTLARDVRARYRERGGALTQWACIVFANCDGVSDDLLTEARSMGAFCLEGDTWSAVRRCSRRTVCSIVLLEDDDVSAITEACKIKEEVREHSPLSMSGETRIFVLTEYRNTESLLFPELLSEESGHTDGGWQGGKVKVRGFDITRELVERVVLRYPLFLLSDPAGDRLPDACWYHVDADEVAACRQRDLYQRPSRHILVVGSGAVGTEFLSSALWTSRIDGVHVRIDVIDNEQDPLHPDKPLAESRYAAEVPEVMRMRAGTCDVDGLGEEPYDLSFSLVDAESVDYVRFLEERVDTLSYVFISLGDDLVDGRVAMRTRQVLDRALAERAADRDEFLHANQPIVVAVIRDDDFADTLRSASNEGQPYDIVCVGNNSDVLTYDMLDDLVGGRATEYKRRSTRASGTHVKYRLFAFARNLLLNRHGVREALLQGRNDAVIESLCRTLEIGSGDETLGRMLAALDCGLDDRTVLGILNEVDWQVDFKGDENEVGRTKGWVLTLLYQLYCTNGVTRALESMESPEAYSREWLLRMEHDRWNAYIRTQGVVSANFGTTGNIFATGQADLEKHRSNLMGLHPCLVSFDALADLEDPIASLYTAYYEEMARRGIDEKRNTKVTGKSWLRLLDDNYIGIKKPEY